VRADGDRLVLALESFHERTGHYPDTLDELVPNEIDRVPTQPDGNPFWYTVDSKDYTILILMRSAGNGHAGLLKPK
jgi:hypothetical protein